MGYSGDSDPRRGPRRYGPSSGRPIGQSAPGGQGGQGGSDNPQYSHPPQGQPYQDQPYQDQRYQDQRYQDQRYQDQRYQDRPSTPSGPAGPAQPGSPGQRAWSQTNPPTRQFPATQGGAGSSAQPAQPPSGRPPQWEPAPGPPPARGPRRPPPDEPGQARARRTRGGVLAARIVALVAAVAVLLGVGVAYVFTDVLQANSGTSDAAANAGSGGVMFNGGMTILLVGSDARTDADGNPLTTEELAQVATEDDGGGINTCLLYTSP